MRGACAVLLQIRIVVDIGVVAVVASHGSNSTGSYCARGSIVLVCKLLCKLLVLCSSSGMLLVLCILLLVVPFFDFFLVDGSKQGRHRRWVVLVLVLVVLIGIGVGGGGGGSIGIAIAIAIAFVCGGGCRSGRRGRGFGRQSNGI